MGMSGGGGGGVNSEINVTPMVDIMLVLLIIFMVVTPLLQQGITVTIPRELRNPDEDPAIIKESSVVISMPADNEIYIGKELIQPQALKAEIERKMEDKTGDDRIVYLKSGVGVSYGEVVKVINVLREAGIDQIGLVADKKKGAGAAKPNPAT